MEGPSKPIPTRALEDSWDLPESRRTTSEVAPRATTVLPEEARVTAKAEALEGPRLAVKTELPEGPRPRRGPPEQTRARLIFTAAQLFNRLPYWETDTNGISKEAGYSTGTFYRHFKDKREIFIAAYREWVAEEWANIESNVTPGQTAAESIDRAADALIEHHRRWRVFRGNLRALVTYDEELRELTHALRREQLEKMSWLRMRQGLQESRTLESDAVHAMMFERVCDAIADGDFASLGCSVELAQREFQRLMRQYLLD
jgi:AcrR family transcriptional regulator